MNQIRHYSRAAIISSAREVFLAGGTIDDCPNSMRHYADVWRYEFQQCQFQASADGEGREVKA